MARFTYSPDSVLGGSQKVLVLSRKIGEKIFIGKDREITVCILDVQGRGLGAQIRVGIDAPIDVPIDREEVVIRREKLKRQEKR